MLKSVPDGSNERNGLISAINAPNDLNSFYSQEPPFDAMARFLDSWRKIWVDEKVSQEHNPGQLKLFLEASAGSKHSTIHSQADSG